LIIIFPLILSVLAPAKSFHYNIPNRYYTVVPYKQEKIVVNYPHPPIGFDKSLLMYINKECERNALPIPLVYKLISLESQWKLHSSSGNRDKKGNLWSIDYGLLQLNSESIPKFIIQFKDAKRSVKSYDPIHDPYDNVQLGLRYLKSLYLQFNSWPKALAGYNAGEKNVKRGTLTLHTKNYVKYIIPVDEWWLHPNNVFIFGDPAVNYIKIKTN
jgi:hypothetical protein